MTWCPSYKNWSLISVTRILFAFVVPYNTDLAWHGALHAVSGHWFLSLEYCLCLCRTIQYRFVITWCPSYRNWSPTWVSVILSLCVSYHPIQIFHHMVPIVHKLVTDVSHWNTVFVCVVPSNPDLSLHGAHHTETGHRLQSLWYCLCVCRTIQYRSFITWCPSYRNWPPT